MKLENGALGGLSTLGVSDAVIARLTLETRVLDIIFPLAYEKLLVSAFQINYLVFNQFFFR